MTEVKPEGLKEILSYIEEREANLARYSDRLRKAICVLEDVFGPTSKCRVCGLGRKTHTSNAFNWDHPDLGWVKNKHGHMVPTEARKKYVNKYLPHNEILALGAEKGWLREGLSPHSFVPCVEVSLDLTDAEAFYIDNGDELWLAFRNHRLVAVRDPDDEDWKFLSHLGRAALKSLIRSGRLTAFLSGVVQTLAQEERDYAEVAELAERLTQAIA